jgi:hypothetical protein
VKERQAHITENYYRCTNEILAGGCVLRINGPVFFQIRWGKLLKIRLQSDNAYFIM